MIVCIAEKPSVARDIAEVLGARERKQGYLEGNGYQVTWTFGHLCTLKEPHDYAEEWRSWNLDRLPLIPPRFGIKLIANPSYEQQFETIAALMREADLIVNCGDAGQEGELIQRWVMLKVGVKCPVKRLWISSLTEESIREGFSHLHPADEYRPLYEAGLARAIGDWLLGINATRLYTLKYAPRGQVLSIGRVQTPTLALIVRRQEEIGRFVPRKYWELRTTYRDTVFTAPTRKSDEELIAEAEKKRKGDEPIDLAAIPNPGMEPIKTEEEGLRLVERLSNLPFEVLAVMRKPGKELPPRLYDLTSLQVDANRKLGCSADETLRLIQSLYEKKLTTYPRVDTTYLSDDIYPKCAATLSGLRGYEDLTRPLAGRPLPKSRKVFDNSKVTDHHAIIPTGRPPQGISEAERQIFDLVARRFIAVFYPECRIETISIEGRVDDILFRAGGRRIVEEGWRAVFAEAPTEQQKAQNDAPASVFGVTFKPRETGAHQPELSEKWTQPPKPYTEATLLRAMETAGKLVEDEELRDALKDNGIGRPSTRAAIIETLYKRNYIRKDRKALTATATGIELIGLIREEVLKSAQLTGIWEKKLREIERRAYGAAQFIDELKQQVAELVTEVRSDQSNRRVTSVSAEEKPAPRGGKRTTAKTAPKPSAGTRTAAETVPALRADDSIIGQRCPLCGRGHILKGKSAYGCSQWKSGCTYRLPFAKH